MEGEVVVRSSTGNKCQDCGNQAKKGCEYKRCRSCCNNKGFKCETHVHSTWVPVDHRRRHREHHHPHFPKWHKPYPADKKDEFKFPGRVSMTAMFRCVQVRSDDDWVSEFAYHTSVTIGGHVFCGLLYDQGPYHGAVAESSSSVPLLQHNDLINVATQTTHNIEAATMASSSARDSIFHYPFPLPAMPYFSNPQP